ncbi:unnamed protein product [Closterium sp. Naga37s-1]|nr:unnamed protein product [Closterium sp. Naga37s-1]
MDNPEVLLPSIERRTKQLRQQEQMLREAVTAASRKKETSAAALRSAEDAHQQLLRDRFPALNAQARDHWRWWRGWSRCWRRRRRWRCSTRCGSDASLTRCVVGAGHREVSGCDARVAIQGPSRAVALEGLGLYSPCDLNDLDAAVIGGDHGPSNDTPDAIYRRNIRELKHVHDLAGEAEQRDMAAIVDEAWWSARGRALGRSVTGRAGVGEGAGQVSHREGGSGGGRWAGQSPGGREWGRALGRSVTGRAGVGEGAGQVSHREGGSGGGRWAGQSPGGREWGRALGRSVTGRAGVGEGAGQVSHREGGSGGGRWAAPSSPFVLPPHSLLSSRPILLVLVPPMPLYPTPFAHHWQQQQWRQQQGGGRGRRAKRGGAGGWRAGGGVGDGWGGGEEAEEAAGGGAGRGGTCQRRGEMGGERGGGRGKGIAALSPMPILPPTLPLNCPPPFQSCAPYSSPPLHPYTPPSVRCAPTRRLRAQDAAAALLPRQHAPGVLVLRCNGVQSRTGIHLHHCNMEDTSKIKEDG